MTETYSKSTDFSNNLKPNQLQSEIIAEGGITTTILRIDVIGDVVNIIFESALSGGEKTLLDGIVSSHTPVNTNFNELIQIIKDEKTTGNNGGTISNGGWVTRDLNTSVGNISQYISLASNQITFQSGTYYIYCTVPAFRVDNHQSRLRNITDGTTISAGTSEKAHNNINRGSTRSVIETVFTITTPKVIEVQHRVNASRSGDGGGLAAGFGENEIYTVITIKKLF